MRRPSPVAFLARHALVFACLSSLGMGGCGDGTTEAPGPATPCEAATSPCASLDVSSGATVFSCVLDSSLCGVDLARVLSQVSTTFRSVDESTVMWIEAWGGGGGSSDKGTGGGGEGYAVTTTTVADIARVNTNSTTIYYFLGARGMNGGDHCGSSGGTSTIVTTENLALSPGADPTQASPPILLVAGGGGGGCSENLDFGCLGGLCTSGGAGGGVAIAAPNAAGRGAGGSNDGTADGGSLGKGGSAVTGNSSGDNAKNGMDGFGGLGGGGGAGEGCGAVGVAGFFNARPLVLGFLSGQGGDGSSNTESCDSGGGGGGGGWGGGGGGGHGNDLYGPVAGGGGASFAIASTRSSDLAPAAIRANPCGGESGCVRISFVAPQ